MSTDDCTLPAPPTRTTAATWGQAISGWLDVRSGATTVAVYDYVSGHLYLAHEGNTHFTASVVKVDILEALLHQRAGKLTAEQESLAEDMIENSDNDAATKLWHVIGEGAGLQRYNDHIPLHDTTPGEDEYWGLTTTTAVDQLKLLSRLAKPNPLLTDNARKHELMLMRHVDACQRWGATYGVPTDVSVAVKNGWLPVHSNYSDWQVNTLGYVTGHGKRYIVAVLSAHNASMNYGVATVDRVAALTWHFMKTSDAW